MAFGDQDLTAANAVIMLAVPGLSIPPFQLQGFAADRVAETAEVDFAETVMGVDGRLSAGYIPAPVDQTFSIMPDSESWPIVDGIITASRFNRAAYRFNGTIRLPAISRAYACTRGIMMRSNVVPPIGRLLEARTFMIRWENVVGALIPS